MTATRFDCRTSWPELINRRRAWYVSENLYEVVSSAGRRRYRVRVVGGVPLCGCQLGVRRRPCWHAAVVLRRLTREGVPGVLKSGS